MSEQGKVVVATYSGGAISDISPEFINSAEGQYSDAENMRSGRNYGYGNGRVKIGGEITIFSDYLSINSATISDMDEYDCVGFTNCKGYLVGFWSNGTTTRVTLDNKLVCESAEVGLLPEYPLQIDTNESCVGGEVFTTDFHVLPMIWNIQELLDAWTANSTTYFSDFNISLITIGLSGQNDKPQLYDFPVYSTGNGLDVGVYAYAIRFVDTTGNRTLHSAFTQLIPMIARDIEFASLQYPNNLTRGGSIGDKSIYGIELKYRVTNVNNYAYAEMIRLRWINGAPLDSPPEVHYCTIPQSLSPGQISVETFIDAIGETLDWTIPTDEEIIQVISSVRAAKAIRYYDNRLELGNIKYNSQTIEDSDYDILTDPTNNQAVYPYIESMGYRGHYDPYNMALYKSYTTGEKCSIGVQFVDNYNNNTFVKEVADVTYPNKRDPLINASKVLSEDWWKGVVYTTDTTNTQNYTHETYNQGTIHKSEATSPDSFTVKDTSSGGTYSPIHPTQDAQDDPLQTGHELCAMELLIQDPTSSLGENGKDCSVFGDNFYATGLALHGIKSNISYHNSFNILRTKPLGRIQSQGLAMYAFNGTGSAYGFSKERNKVWYLCTDKEAAISNAPVAGQKIQFVSPIGFSTEFYNAFEQLTIPKTIRGIDMLVHAKIQYNKTSPGIGSVNVGLPQRATGGGTTANYPTEFGVWRKDLAVAANPFNNAGVINGNKEFTISNVSTITSSGTTVYEITFAPDLYVVPNHVTTNTDANDTNVQGWHEPFYVAQVINDSVDFNTQNFDTYYQTGYSQKFRSIIGDLSSGATSYQLVDERHEDCIPYYYASNTALFDCFITIVDKLSGEEKKWLNVTHKSSGFISTVQAALLSPGYYDIINPYPAYTPSQSVRIYGIYTSTFNTTNNGYFSTIDFTYGLPSNSNSSYVVVEYDERFPFKFFGGDVVTSINVGCPLQGQTDHNGDPVSEYSFGYYGASEATVCFPYPKWKFVSKDIYERIKNSASALNYKQQEEEYRLGKVRQMLVEWIGDTKIDNCHDYNIATAFGYPRCHYIMQPEKWNNSNWADNFGNNKISTQYQTDYPSVAGGDNYASEWGYGGFKYKTTWDIDYSELNVYNPSITKPLVGFTEVTDYCSRIIWSERRNINQQNEPNLKTFPALNAYDLPDAYGAIKYLFNTDSAKGENLYAFTETGTAFLMTNKRMITEASGNELTAEPPNDSLIQGQIWLRTDQGMNDEMWRSAAEWANSIVWANKDSVWVLLDNTVRDIGRVGYYKQLYDNCLSRVASDYDSKIAAVYDNYHQEYFLTQSYGFRDVRTSELLNSNTAYALGTYDDGVIGLVVWNYDGINILDCSLIDPYVYLPSAFTDGQVFAVRNSTGVQMYIYGSGGFNISLPNNDTAYLTRDSSTSLGWVRGDNPLRATYACDLGYEVPQWNGTYDYIFDKYTCLNGLVYGVRDGKIWKLNQGYTLNNITGFNGSIKTIVNADQMFDKEFISVAVASVQKPSGIDFSTVITTQAEATLDITLGAGYLKNYGKWTNKIPRKIAAPRNRMQGRYLSMDIYHTVAEPFILNDVAVNYKLLKLQM